MNTTAAATTPRKTGRHRWSVRRWLRAPASVRARLALLLTLAAVAVALVGGLGVFGTRSGGTTADDLYDRGVVTVARMGDLREAMSRLARFEMEMIVNHDSPPLTDAARTQWRAAHTLATERIAQIAAGAAGDDRAEGLTGFIGEGIERYKAGFDTFAAKLEKGEILSAGVGNQLMAEHRNGFTQATAALEQLQALVRQDTAALRQRAQTRAAWLVRASALAAAVGLALTLAVGWVTVRAVNAQIAEAGRTTTRIADGDLRAPGAQALRPHGEIGLLLAALDGMQASLRQLVAGVQHGAGSISTASAEIASGSRELSARTESSAAHLQQIAGTLQALDGSAAGSNTQARESARLAGSVAAEAAAAAEAASSAVGSMNDIQRSAARIAEITAQIAAIAFQTDLLALNAAVEAAHAGEHGKGFAVVAGEIQGLAKRASRAASDIKALADTSAHSVAAGVSAVGRTEQSVQGIAREIHELASLATELAGQTSVQTQRINEVAGVTRRLDDATQQNSALAEQSTAAAESLRAQAQQLQGLVAVFRV